MTALLFTSNSTAVCYGVTKTYVEYQVIAKKLSDELSTQLSRLVLKLTVLSHVSYMYDRMLLFKGLSRLVF